MSISRMALEGVRVVEMAGLAPGPFCGMVLADFGADVVRVDRVGTVDTVDRLARGKKSIALNLKNEEGIEVARKLCDKADVLIEPFRPGVMEKLGLGPELLMKRNPGLIYARLTGYGQYGSMAQKAGHDINYISMSGVLSSLGRKHEKPYAPINLLADFAGGGLMCAMGIAMALFERTKSGQGQIIDASMVEGAAYVSSFLWKTRDLFIWQGERGENALDGGAAFYDTYETKDGKYMAVGALEPQFYADFVKGLGLDPFSTSQYGDPVKLKDKFTSIFLTKTQAEWTKVFDKLDACVTPVLSKDAAGLDDHAKDRKSFLLNMSDGHEPAAAPQLSRTPAVGHWRPDPAVGQHTTELLSDLGYSNEQIQNMIRGDAVMDSNVQSKI